MCVNGVSCVSGVGGAFGFSYLKLLKKGIKKKILKADWVNCKRVI
jgi:hypothetical protein